MRKTLNVFLVFLITLFTIPFGGLNVSAEGKVYDNIKDGQYEIEVEFKQDGSDETSLADQYVSDESKLIIKDGQAELVLAIPKIPGFEFEKFKVEGTTFELETKGDVDYYKFKLDQVKPRLEAVVTYSLTGDFELRHDDVPMGIVLYGLEDLPTIEEEPEEDVTDSEEDSSFDLEDGFYTVTASYVNVKDGSNSAMASYLSDNVFLAVDSDKVEMTITVNDNNTVTLLQVEENNPVEVVKDGEKNYETFKLDTLTNVYNAYTEYQAPFGDSIFEGQADFLIVIDGDSLEKASKNDKPGYVEHEDPQRDDDKDKGKGEGDEKEPKPKPEKPSKKDLLTPDKAYKIDYTILHEDGTKPSVADPFFEKPGILLEKDGIKYLQMTVENGDMVRSLSNKYGEYILVDQKSDGTKVMQLRVPSDLSDMKLDMHIVVPEGAIPGFRGYDKSHGAILTFGDATEISVGNHMLAPSGDKNNLNGPYVEGATTPGGSEEDNNGKQPDKPELGENGDNKKGEKTDENPKTGDTSQILFFSTLLVASLSVLVLQVRRRLAA